MGSDSCRHEFMLSFFFPANWHLGSCKGHGNSSRCSLRAVILGLKNTECDSGIEKRTSDSFFQIILAKYPCLFIGAAAYLGKIYQAELPHGRLMYQEIDTFTPGT